MQTETDVLIIGAGPTGLAAAIELGLRGVRAIVVERNDRSGTAPRAKTTNVRTRTHLRRWAIAGRLAEESPFGIDYPNNMVFVTRLAGPELTRFANAFNASPERSPLYPEHGQWIPQYRLEKVLFEKARTIPSLELHFDTSFVSAVQDESGVTASVEQGGSTLEIRARYLIGADGARSAVRDLIGAKMEGRYGLIHAYNIIFRAPGLAQAHKHGPAAIYWQIGKDGFSAIGPMDVNDTWFFAPAGVPAGQKISDQDAVALIRQRTGIQDVPIEILSADQWAASELLADRYRQGRILLAGDSCHLHPPAGGYGMNMGIGDGVDLGWKIAATLQGWGGPALIAAYEAERRPVHRAVIDEAMANFAIYTAAPPPVIEEETEEGAGMRQRMGAVIQGSKGREFNTLGTVLGLGYEGSPLVAHELGAAPERDSQIYVPSARPGSLAPHAWLSDGRSLYDLFGQGFSLVIARGADEKQIAAAVAQAEEMGVPLELARPEGVAVSDLYRADLTLVRPDQHVAWRGNYWNDDVLRRATGRE